MNTSCGHFDVENDALLSTAVCCLWPGALTVKLHRVTLDRNASVSPILPNEITLLFSTCAFQRRMVGPVFFEALIRTERRPGTV